MPKHSWFVRAKLSEPVGKFNIEFDTKAGAQTCYSALTIIFARMRIDNEVFVVKDVKGTKWYG